jgi:hypothetical protein
VLIGIGGHAFIHNELAAHFEGFVLVISLALVLQGLLMLIFLGWHRPSISRYRNGRGLACARPKD